MVRNQGYVPRPPGRPPTPVSPTATPTLTAPAAKRPAGVGNPANRPMEDFLLGQLDPNSSTYLGRQFRPEIDAAGNQLKAGLTGYGNYDFKDQGGGALQPIRGTSAKGYKYRDAIWDARARMNAQGALHSSRAQEAVGTAFGRVSEEERAHINAYAQKYSGVIGQWQERVNAIGGQLTELYGDDVQYSLRNPPPPPPPPPAAPKASTPGAPAKPAAAKKPKMTYKAWLQKHYKDGRSTAKRSAAYRRQMGLPPLKAQLKPSGPIRPYSPNHPRNR